MKCIKIYTIVSILILLTGCSQKLGADLTPIQQEILDKPWLQLKTTKDKILESRDIDDIRCSASGCINLGKIKSYDYISETKTAKNVLFRQGEKYSNTVIADKDTFHFYSGDHFSKETNGIYEIEHGATTTIAAFNEQTKIVLMDKIKSFFEVLADNYYATDGDGYVASGWNTVWATVHDLASGSATGEPAQIDAVSQYYSVNNSYYIYRGFVPIDTSGLGAGATISAASLFLDVNTKMDVDNDGLDYINIVQGFQASVTALEVGDYEDCGSDDGTAARAKYTPIQTGATSKDITSMGTAYEEFVFNATGISWIDKTGTTKLGVREGHDIENTAVNTGVDMNQTGVNFEGSSTTGTSKDPYLSITFTSPSSPEDESYIVE